MKRIRGRLALLIPVFVTALVFGLAPAGNADTSFANVADQVNQKVVKLFGSGGFKGLVSYGTGVVVSPDGYIFTINSHILDTRDLRIHMADGTKYHGKVVCAEPELDVALVKIDVGKDDNGKDKNVELEHYFDFPKAAGRPLVEPGTGILAFSNQFQIATRDEPMSVQRGVVAANCKLVGRIGVFEAPYKGDVYVIDAITNNPGAGGGVITTRKGEMIGMIGREVRNELTNTWMNYAVPWNAKVTVKDKEGKKRTVSILDLWNLKEKYKPIPPRPKEKNNIYTGLILVPNVVERTPPYVEEVEPGSPAEISKLKPDDLIVYVDGIPVNDINSFEELMATYTPGFTVKLEVQRADKLMTIEMKLAKPKDKKP
jgi:serine protease Do